MSYDINYQDERFQEVESDKKAALSELNKTYDGMVQESDKFYQAQVDASKEWEQTQTKLQQEQTDFAIQQVEQQKDQAHKDYLKEQSGAYVDWKKQSNPYGARAEQLADNGMQTTGYAESSQVAMYTAYQNRVATARESYNQAMVDYNNAITQARLQNNSALAEIAQKGLQQRLELALQGFQYKNTLLLEKANRKTELDQMYHSRYQDVLSQINTENALAEQIRQFNTQLAEEQRQFNLLHQDSGRSGGNGSNYSPKPKKDTDGGKEEEQPKIKRDSGSSDATIDTKSVLAMGYGPISGEKLADLEAKGEVSITRNGNKLVAANKSAKSRKAITTGKYFSKYNF